MAPPAKRQKLNNSSKKANGGQKGLEFFFNRQREASPTKSNSQQAFPASSNSIEATEYHGLTDEEYARKLQAEWDLEANGNSPTKTSESKDGNAEGQFTDALSDLKYDIQSESGVDIEKSPSPTKQDNGSSKKTAVTGMTMFFKPKNTLSLQSVELEEDTVSHTIPFDESPLTFEPAKYIPDLKKTWSIHGGSASYALLVRCFVLVNGTSSRIKIVDTLVNMLRTIIEVDPESLLPAVWLTTNAISPPYISLELGLGGSAISKALTQVYDLNRGSLKSLYDKFGDPGDVAFEAKKKQSFRLSKPKPLTIKGVFDGLVKISTIKGSGSGEQKQKIVNKLLQDASSPEDCRFVVRTVCQNLRIGAVKTTLLIALSRAFLLSKPAGAEFPTCSREDLKALKKEQLAEIWAKAEETLKACFARRPNYNDIVPTLLEIGVCDELLVRCGLTLHIPLMPMLGSITRDLSEMLTKLQGRDFTCEYKYDGQRAQVHCDDKGKVSIFSRHLEMMTDKYPDLVALIPKIRGEGVSSFIMEGEVVAVDKTSGDLKTFQVLTNRARKDVAIGSITVNVCLFAFDLMYLNGQPLLDRPFRERRELLRSLFVEVPQQFTWVKSIDATSQDSEIVLEFFKSATDTKCEGIMVKILDNLEPAVVEEKAIEEGMPPEQAATELLALPNKKKKGKKSSKDDTEDKPKTRRKPLLATYEPDKRLDSWLKVKKDYASTFDSLDLIPIAGWHGQGRKASWWSPILLAVRNETTGSLEAVCKCMSGFTDAFYKANKEFYAEGSANVLSSKPGYVEYNGGYPDVWFEPQEVWEMAFADITISPVYTAAIGLVHEDKGLSLRFPRFLKKREDKSIDEASTSEFLAGLWRKQEAKAPAAKAVEEVEEE